MGVAAVRVSHCPDACSGSHQYQPVGSLESPGVALASSPLKMESRVTHANLEDRVELEDGEAVWTAGFICSVYFKVIFQTWSEILLCNFLPLCLNCKMSLCCFSASGILKLIDFTDI